MRGYRFVYSLLATVAVAATLLAQTPDTTPLVRLSYVQGQVSILQDETTEFGQAQANMPLLAGYTLSTGQNGQAEVEFIDGSVARLTPQSKLRLVRLPAADARGDVTEVEMVSGLGYFELNTADGQHFAVNFHGAVAQPTENSIFRINLDDAPDLSVFAGSVHAYAGDAFDQTVGEGNSLRFAKENLETVNASPNIQPDSWDQWNQDRDDLIAREAQQQTSARETSGASNEPGWDDLDYYGDWYPMEGYGNVWMPSDVPSGWDPYGSGYWASYPGFGATWVSAYPWGWLPYHCGAWNYWDGPGWGWIPGQCGQNWHPTGRIWNSPSGWRFPPRPIPGGHVGPPTVGNRLVAVNRGPALPSGGVTNAHTRPIHVGDQRLDPLPVVQNPTMRGGFTYRTAGGSVGIRPAPVMGHGYAYGGGQSGVVHGTAPGAGFRGGASPGPGTPAAAPRPVFRPAPVPQGPRLSAPSPQPRVGVPSAPHYSPPPAPRMSAPPASAPHMSAPPSGGHH